MSTSRSSRKPPCRQSATSRRKTRRHLADWSPASRHSPPYPRCCADVHRYEDAPAVRIYERRNAVAEQTAQAVAAAEHSAKLPQSSSRKMSPSVVPASAVRCTRCWRRSTPHLKQAVMMNWQKRQRQEHRAPVIACFRSAAFRHRARPGLGSPRHPRPQRASANSRRHQHSPETGCCAPPGCCRISYCAQKAAIRAVTKRIRQNDKQSCRFHH